jgi:EAL domain-containing protein (putative c-di-GMP-specific phosphodiesterase class I)
MKIFGFEALVRNNLHRNFNTLELFHQAQTQRYLTLLDYQLILKAQQIFSCKSNSSLFINIFPSTLLDKRFTPWWHQFSGIVPSVILELSEEEPISDWETLKSVICDLKKSGVKIAVDDMGEGYSFLRHWMDLEPDYIKLDRCYMFDLIENKSKQKALKNLVNIIGDTAEVIVEGVEKIDCLEIVKDAGAQYAQGYALGRPAPIDRFSNGK